jgi:SpoVK/Ycf46/Vps4 family AAA+-type ATPase
MKTEDRRLIIHYLNNVLKGSLSPELRDRLWGWFSRHDQEMFHLDLEIFDLDLGQIKEQVAEAIEGRSPGRGRRSDERRVWEARIRLLKKTVAEAKPLASPSRTDRIGGLSEKIADSFHLKGAERDVLRFFVGAMSLPVLDDLMDDVTRQHSYDSLKRQNFPDVSRLLALSAGETERAFRRESPLLANGLFSLDDEGEISVSEPLKKMVNQPRQAGRDLKSLVLGKKAKASLARADFEHLGPDYDHLVKILGPGLTETARGLNVLLYGPPGTGKTELAKSLAAAIQADLYPVSETSADNSREARRAELQTARALTAGDPRAMLLVDEAEDVFGDSGREGKNSKLFFNRMLENNETPIIWITNHVRALDPAYLRRFTYALEVKTPPASARARIWRKELARKKVKMADREIERLARNYELPPSYAVSAIRAARLARDPGAVERTLASLEYAVTGRPKLIHDEEKADFNPALLNTDVDLPGLTERVLNGRLSRFSLCLFGAPGTGKSEYARYLAGRMGLEVLHKRASDLLDMYVGNSEKNIAEAFGEAREEKKFLIFDEADSLLRDRGSAVRSWEATQVNEMLTWMERHPYPFACTTNLMDSLDQASLRRFTFQVKYEYLTREQAGLAFRHFFGQDAKVELEALTPGDFAVAARKAAIMGLTAPAELLAMLAREQEAKGVKSTAMGFGIGG